MQKRKIILLTTLYALGLAVIAALMVASLLVSPKSVSLINCPTEISCTGLYPGNYRQRTANIWLGCYGGKLYYYGGNKDDRNKTKYDDSLCVFEEGALVELAHIPSRGKNTVTIIGVVDHHLYYRECTNSDYSDQKLYCFDLETNALSLLFCGDLSVNASMYFADDGSVYIPLSPEVGKPSQYVHVSGTDVLGIEELTKGYPLGDSIYFVVKEFSDVQAERIIQTDLGGNTIQEEISLEQSYNRSVIPYEDGLLIHNEQLNTLLYRIDREGGITELFRIPCLASESAVNIHGTDAYISILRYEKYGEKGMLRYKNDSLEGTYRISLRDGSVEKINDMCLDGIYNFDDTCFYCCDKDGNIYRMEFDGYMSPILLVLDNN